MKYIKTLDTLIEEFKKFPTIGRKTAERLAFNLLSKDPIEVDYFIKSILDATKNLSTCPTCGIIMDKDECSICNNEERSDTVICVVESSKDAFFFEKLSIYDGVYHVLGGVISPIDNIGPKDINIASLLDRVTPNTKEVIIATNADLEGEATASYLSRLIKSKSIKVSRLAHGLPMGADIEYADEVTLAKALEARREL